MFTRIQSGGKNHGLNLANKYFGNMTKSKLTYLWTTLANQNGMQEALLQKLNLQNIFYYPIPNCDGLIDARKVPNLEDHPLLAIRYCLFYILETTILFLYR